MSGTIVDQRIVCQGFPECSNFIQPVRCTKCDVSDKCNEKSYEKDEGVCREGTGCVKCIRNGFFGGNKLACCLGETPKHSDEFCQKAGNCCAKCWCPGNPACRDVLIEYCSQKDEKGRPRLLTDARCDHNSAFAHTIIGASYPRDEAVSIYCQRNNYPEECYCVAPNRAPDTSAVGMDVHLASKYTGMKLYDERNITCWSPECIMNGRNVSISDSRKYIMTRQLEYPDCTNIPNTLNICAASFDIWQSEGIDVVNQVIQNCQFSPSNPPAGCQTEQDMMKDMCKPFRRGIGTDDAESLGMWVVIGVLVGIFLFFGAIYLRQMSKDKSLKKEREKSS